jgi:hypothetical protein
LRAEWEPAGLISQMSSHGATPISASSRASGSTKPDLSSLACERKARTAEAPLSTSTKDALPAAPPRRGPDRQVGGDQGRHHDTGQTVRFIAIIVAMTLSTAAVVFSLRSWSAGD